VIVEIPFCLICRLDFTDRVSSYTVVYSASKVKKSTLDLTEAIITFSQTR